MIRRARPHMLSRTVAGLVLAGLLVALPAGAATFDPDLTWRTIRTEHFHIHFHQGEEALADRFADTVERIHTEMVGELRWRPRARTHVVLIDQTDVANGFAGSIPYNAITIFVTAPTEDGTLAHHEDWLTAIQTHEYTHTLHIDSNHGIVRAARWTVGRIASTNGLSPAWLVEGLATLQETRHTNGGRGRTPYVAMVLRTAALEDDWPALGRMDGYQARPPAGQIRYLFGQDFMQHVSDHHGRDVWTRWIHTYGARLPYLLPARKVFGASFRTLHRAWEADRLADAQATVERLEAIAPLTPDRSISDPEASCTAPTFAPTGDKLVWSCRDPRKGSQIWMADGAGHDPEKILQDRGARNFAWRADGEAFVYAGLHVVNRFNTWSDLYMHTLGQKAPTPLTQGARARDPSVSPDGSRLLMVTNAVQHNQLEVLTVDRRRRVLTAHGDRVQLSTPRYSPDGNWIAISVWKDGRRDLWLYTAEGQPWRQLTFDDAIDRDPRWSADGRTLWFASDRTGIPNVFAIDLDEDRLWQLSHTATGSVMPSPHPDGTRVAWQTWHAHGWQVEVHPIDRSTWIDHGRLRADLRAGHHPTLAPPESEVRIRGEVADAAPEPEPTPLGHVPVDPVQDRLPGRPEPFGVTRPRLRGDAVQSFLSQIPPLPHPPDGEAEPWGTSVRTVPEVPPPARQSTGGIDSFDQAEVDDAFGAEEDHDFRIEPRRYTPLGPLAPRYWIPFVQITPFASRAPLGILPFGVYGSASTGSVDPVRHYAWSASANFRTDANFVGGAASFTLNRWIPVYSLSVSRRADPSSRYVVVDPDTPTTPDGDPNLVFDDDWYWQQVHTITASVDYPYTFRTSVFGRYQISFRSPLDPIPASAVRDRLPLRGALGTVQGGWRYAWSQPTATAISREDARIVSLVGGVVHPFLGAYALDADDQRQGLTAVQLTAELREYRVMPWSANHVLAMRVAGGASVGQDSFLGLYQLGGSFGDSAFYVTPTSSRMVRGYPLGARVGDAFWLGGLEYRFPISRIDHGIGTLPVFVRALSANAFVDVGNAFDRPDGWGGLVEASLVGIGAELRASAILWYGVPFTARFGVASGLTGEEGIKPLRETDAGRRFDSRLFYARVGGSF